MPTLASVSIPSLHEPPSDSKSDDEESNDVRAPQLWGFKHSHNDDPLPIAPSERAMADAKIVSREIGPVGVLYTIKIGEVELNSVALHEVLDYVSPQDLEDFEYQQFEEEAELERIAEEANRRCEEVAKQRARERAKREGIAGYYGPEGGDVVDDIAPEVATGRHGRARPVYKHLFELPRQRRRRRKRDPITGELMPRRDDDEMAKEVEEDAGASDDAHKDAMDVSQGQRESVAPSEMPKRRRRRRDPATGELLPLKPLPSTATAPLPSSFGFDLKKRPRRRRHPQTGELMPLGWRYDPSEAVKQPSSSSRRGGMGAMSPAMHRLSLSQDHGAKRVKLNSQSSSGASVAQAVIPNPARQQQSGSEDDSSSEDEVPAAVKTRVTKPTLQQIMATRGMLGVPAALQSTATSSGVDTSPEPEVTTTSIMQPIAGTSAMPENVQEDDDSDEPGEGEFVIEAILAHHLSDPRTHPTEYGKKPVMLYKVKWEGWDDPTWEPIDSFPDRSVVDDYHRMVDMQRSSGKGKQPTRAQSPNKERATTAEQPKQSMQASAANPKPTVPPPQATSNSDHSADDSDDSTYEVERILEHHISDPRTHAPEYGKNPVMLYRVKWKGYTQLTWEPAASFEDLEVLRRYQKTVGLPLEAGSTEDDENEADRKDEDIKMASP